MSVKPVPVDIHKYHCFPETLEEGLRWFQAAVEQHGGHYESATVPGLNGPGGERLTTGVAWFGNRNAESVYLSIAGTHGQEYFCGAAGQLAWITSGAPAELPANVAVCMVHGHNPYGAVILSRGNENFVDLNRNYQDFVEPVRENRLYPELFNLLFTKDMSEHVLDDVMASFYEYLQSNDTFEVLTAMGGGQDTHPSGTIYCGTKQEWSTRNLKAVVREFLSQAERVVVIDWHTGLGEPSEAVALARFAPDSPRANWAEKYWAQNQAAPDLQGEESPDFVGEIYSGVALDLEQTGASVISTVYEVGTVGNQSVLAALLIDRWLRFECTDPQGPRAAEYRTKMIERLNPSRPEWRAASAASMAEVYKNTIAGLQDWI